MLNHSNEDLKQYALILKEADASKSAVRYKEVLKQIQKSGSGLAEAEGPKGSFAPTKGQTDPIVVLSDNPAELFDRLNILITARKEGHNSSENEIHAILKRLLEKILSLQNNINSFFRKLLLVKIVS